MTKLAALIAVALLAPAAADAKAPARPIAKMPAKQISKAAPRPVVEEPEPEVWVDPVDKRRDALPAAPDSDAEYVGWKKRLTPKQRAAVERFCRYDRPADYEPHCGGIGIHRIPTPPSLVAAGNTFAMHGAWKKSLSQVQRRTYEHLCSGHNVDTYGYSQLCGGTPLVVAFDHTVAFTPASAGFATDWPTAATPWLALDRDGDGAITAGPELFGGDTVLANGRTAKHGFEALADLDANGDGRIDRADPMFASLVLWADHDGSRTSSRGELTPAARVIDAIELGFRSEPRCDARLNCERERSVVHFRGADGSARTGSVVDVYLHYR